MRVRSRWTWRSGSLLLGLLLMLTGAAAQAAIYPARVQSAAWLRSTTFGDPPNAIDVGDPSQASLSRGYNGTGYSITSQAASATRMGTWGGYAEVGGFTSFGGFATVQASSNANGFMGDNLTIAQGSKMVLPVHVTGDVLIQYSAAGNLPPSGAISAAVSMGITCSMNPFNGSVYLPATDCTKVLSLTQSQTVDTTLLLEIPFQANQVFSLWLTPTVSAGIYSNSGGSPTDVTMTYRAMGDFGDTVVFGPAQIFDSNNNLLTAVAITSESGFDYAVPEPAGWSSLAAGFGALTVLGRRRRAPGPLGDS